MLLAGTMFSVQIGTVLYPNRLSVLQMAVADLNLNSLFMFRVLIKAFSVEIIIAGVQTCAIIWTPVFVS